MKALESLARAELLELAAIVAAKAAAEEDAPAAAIAACKRTQVQALEAPLHRNRDTSILAEAGCTPEEAAAYLHAMYGVKKGCESQREEAVAFIREVA